MKNIFLIFCTVVLLSACGSTVPLGDVPVTDAAPKTVFGTDGGANGAGVKGSGVAAVDLGSGSASAIAPSEPRVVYFDYDSYVIKPDFQSVIAAHARFVKAHPERKLAIEGHTDETGGREYNLALGQKRADAVRDALAILGVSQTQMESVSFGKEKPAVAGNDEAAFSKNRRAEIRYQ
ncbi:MAG: peptidoglycan-associated lipoprotein Pal [Rhodoferax sp.]|uniref:peptidoglycan-associated lipoprotein Pal n=1 Tax=Rhodoferax sp. TaxID=50421 RepID=UPI002608CFEA|nr:peptidoglycan-associated lipoprotein Pal [Rhodoferax sp.]MDD2879270.1 peptidoglycan-associated lipoprotein Pal [Rhodoferax sp.]